MATGSRGGAGDEQHGTREAHDDTQGPPWGDALVEDEGREDEREDGHGGQLDGGVDGRGEAQAHDIAALGHDKAKEAGAHNLQQVAALDVLLRHNQRPHPEEDCRTANPEGDQLRTRDAPIGEDVLRKGSHQPEQHHRQQHGPMRLHVLVIGHHFICH